MTSEPTLLMSLDLAGTFIYALNGGLTAVRAARLDIVGVVTLAMVSGLGGGIIRDIPGPGAGRCATCCGTRRRFRAGTNDFPRLARPVHDHEAGRS